MGIIVNSQAFDWRPFDFFVEAPLRGVSGKDSTKSAQPQTRRILAEVQKQADAPANLLWDSTCPRCTVRVAQSDFALHPTAAIFGETDALLSMIASRSPEAAASQRLVID